MGSARAGTLASASLHNAHYSRARCSYNTRPRSRSELFQICFFVTLMDACGLHLAAESNWAADTLKLHLLSRKRSRKSQIVTYWISVTRKLDEKHCDYFNEYFLTRISKKTHRKTVTKFSYDKKIRWKTLWWHQ